MALEIGHALVGGGAHVAGSTSDDQPPSARLMLRTPIGVRRQRTSVTKRMHWPAAVANNVIAFVQICTSTIASPHQASWR
jgi:hypothetical protein